MMQTAQTAGVGRLRGGPGMGLAIGMAIGMLGAAAALAPAQGTVSLWRLDAAGGSAVALDSGGTANGVVNGDVSFGHVGAFAGSTAARFDGNGDYIEIAHDDAYLLDEGTISLWFHPLSMPGRAELISKDSTNYDTGGHITAYVDSSGRVQVRLQSDTRDTWLRSGSGSIGRDAWHHMVITFGEGGAQLYIDGALADDDTYTGGLGASSGGVGNFEPMVIGGNTWQSGDLVATPVKNFFNGYIDDVRIYDARLSSTGIAQAMAGGVGETDPLPVPYATDFEDDLHESWTERETDSTTSLTEFMGPFGLDVTFTPTTSATVRTVPGERYIVEFDAYVFGGWDVSGRYQDDFIVEADGAELLRTHFDPRGGNGTGPRDAYGNYAYGDRSDGIFRDVRVRFTATGAQTVLTFRGEHTGADEGWAIDNLSIDVAGAAETPFFDSFASGTGDGWTGDYANDSVEDLSMFAGPFATGEAAELALATTAGATYTMAFDLFVLGDWDGEDMSVLVDGAGVFSERFEAGTFPRVNGRAPDHATDADNDGITDLVYRVVTLTFTASDEETTIRFESGLDQNAGDEAFGIDNVMVFAGGGTPGLNAAWVSAGSGLNRLSDVAFDAPTHESIESHIGWANQRDEFYPDGPDQQFGLRLSGQIVVPETGDWSFRLGSDDGSRMDLNGSTLIDNSGLHSFRTRDATTTLDAGAHDIGIDFFERTGWKGLVLQWRGPGVSAWETVPGWAFRRGASMFTDVSGETGFDLDTGASAGDGAGLIFFDIDHDGDLDAIAGGANGAVLAYTGGVFIEARRADMRGQIGVHDADRDGRLDLFLPMRERVELNTGSAAGWTNAGDRGFVEPSGTRAAAAADLNADGRADLISFAGSGNHVAIMLDPEDESDPFDLDLPIIGAMGLNDSGDYGAGGFVAAGDANNDGRLDFYVDRSGGRLFLSTGEGTYVEDQSLVAGSASGVGAAWADYDNDGDIDLLIPGRGTPPRLLRNEGDAFAFTDVAASAGLTTTANQRGAAWGDADNDGDLDLYLTTDEGAANVLYLNSGEEPFAYSAMVPAESAEKLDASWVDFDSDGDSDLAMITTDGLVLMRNELDRNDALRVIVGPGLSRRVAGGAIGTRVELFDAGGSRVGLRELGVARGFAGVGPFEATFAGIDTSATYRVVVTWPGGASSSGEVVPAASSASVGGATIPRAFDIATLEPPGVRVIRWSEVAPSTD